MKRRVRTCLTALLLLLALCVFFAGCKGGTGEGAEPGQDRSPDASVDGGSTGDGAGQEREPDMSVDDRGSDIEMPEVPMR